MVYKLGWRVRGSPHTFSHTFAKMCVQSGANVFELQQILGHSSLEMVRKLCEFIRKNMLIEEYYLDPVDFFGIDFINSPSGIIEKS